MKIAIIGVGAMGSLFGAYLAPLASVVMIGNWPEQLATVRGQGLIVVQSDGSKSHHLVPASHDLKEAKAIIGGLADLALILVKSYQTERAAAQAGQILAPDGLALTLQNGLGNLTRIAAIVGPERATLGVTAQGATMVGPGVVRHAGHGPTHLAHSPPTSLAIAATAALFGRAGLETHLVDNVDSLVWGKLAINAGINPLTALLRVPNGFLAKHEPLRRLMGLAATEAAAIAQAQGIELPYPDAAQRAVEVAQATAANYSSMLQDVLRGAPTEIEAICGAIVEYGKHLNIATPVNERLLHLVRELEIGHWSLEIKGNDLEANVLSLLFELFGDKR
jgi:2-dehydropantoate 2-reductase